MFLCIHRKEEAMLKSDLLLCWFSLKWRERSFLMLGTGKSRGYCLR